ncbi:hypothetical protein Dimus_001295 [Dionaea muscipula]
MMRHSRQQEVLNLEIIQSTKSDDETHELCDQDHELPYGDWLTMIFEEFGVPLVDKKGEEPKQYDCFEETFLTMCKLKRQDGIWWIGSGENIRRDDAPEEEGPAENVHEEEEEGQTDFDWETVIDEATVQGESRSDDQFFNA